MTYVSAVYGSPISLIFYVYLGTSIWRMLEQELS